MSADGTRGNGDSDRDTIALIESAVSAVRPRDLDGRLQGSPAFHDLAPADRERVFEETVVQRRIEAIRDRRSLSQTARNVLDAID